jgi:hypothetical protein
VSPAKRIVMSPFITSRVPEDGDGGQTGFNAFDLPPETSLSLM